MRVSVLVRNFKIPRKGKEFENYLTKLSSLCSSQFGFLTDNEMIKCHYQIYIIHIFALLPGLNFLALLIFIFVSSSIIPCLLLLTCPLYLWVYGYDFTVYDTISEEGNKGV